MSIIFEEAQIGIYDIDGYKALLENVFDLNILDHAMLPVIEVILDAFLSIDLDLNSSRRGSYANNNSTTYYINVDDEQETIVNVLVYALQTLESLEIQYVSELVNHFKELISGINSDINEGNTYFAEGYYTDGIIIALETIGNELETVDREKLLAVVDSLLSIKLVSIIGYEFYNQSLYESFTGDMAVLGDLHDYNAANLSADLSIIVDILGNIFDSGIHTMGITKEFVSEDVIPHLENLIKNICKLDLLETKVEDLGFILSLVFGDNIDVSAINTSNINLEEDGEVLATMIQPVYTVVKAAFEQGVSEQLLVDTEVFNAIIDIYLIIISTSLVENAAPSSVKAVINSVKDSVDENTAKVIEALEAEGLSDNEILEDLTTLARIARTTESLGFMNTIINQADLEITDANGYATLLEQVFDLNIIDHKFVNTLSVTIETYLSVDLSNSLFSTMDADVEQAIIVEFIREIIPTINSLGITTVNGFSNYADEVIPSISEDFANANSYFANGEYLEGASTAFETIAEQIENLNNDKLYTALDILFNSEIIVYSALPIYNQLIFENFTGNMLVIGDIHDYSEEELFEDLDIINDIIKSLLDSNIHSVGITGELPEKECIGYIESIIKDVFNLNIINKKTQDIDDILEFVFPEFVDPSTIRTDKINLSKDGDTLSKVVEPIYDIITVITHEKVSIEILTQKVITDSIINIYDTVVSTTIIENVAPNIIKGFVNETASSQSGLVKDIVEAIDINHISDKEIYEDLNRVTDILKEVIKLNIVTTLIEDNDVMLSDKDGYEDLLDDVFELNIIDNSLMRIIELLIENALGIELDDATMAAISVEHEQIYLINAVLNVLDVFESLGIEYISDIMPYYVDLVKGFNKDIRKAFKYFSEGNYSDGIPALFVTIGKELETVDQESLLDVFYSLFALDLIPVVALSAYDQLFYENVEGDMEVIADIHNYSYHDLSYDLALIVRVVEEILNSDIHTMGITGEFVERDCVRNIQYAIQLLFNLKLLDKKEQDIQEIVTMFLGDIEFIDADFDSIDFAYDGIALSGTIDPLYTIIEAVLEEGLTIELLIDNNVYNSLVEIYQYILCMTSVNVIVPSVIRTYVNKFADANDNIIGTILEALQINNTSSDQIMEDLLRVSVLAILAKDYGIVDSLINKEDIIISTDLTNIVELVLSFNIVSNSFINVVKALTKELFNVILTSSYSYEDEKQVILTIVNDAILVLNSLGITTIDDIIPYITDVKDGIAFDIAGVKSYLAEGDYESAICSPLYTISTELNKVDQEALVEIIEALADSKLITTVALTVYDKLFYSKLTGITATICDLHDYPYLYLSHDLNSIAEIISIILDSKILDMGITNELPGEECMTYIDEILNVVAEMEIVKIKLTDLGEILDYYIGDYVDLTDIDFTQIDIARDGKLIIGAAAVVGLVAVVLLEDGASLDTLNNEAIINAVLDVYELIINSSIGKEVLPDALKALADIAKDNTSGIAYEIVCALNIESLTDDQIMSDLVTIGDIARSLVDLGLISAIINEEEISLTDVDAFEELLSNIFGMNIIVNASGSLVDVLVNEYVPFDLTEANLSSINYEEELQLIVDVVVLALEIVNSLGIETVSEATDYAKVVFENILIDIKDATNKFADKEYVDALSVALNTVIDQLKAVDKSKVLELVETICDSQILLSVVLPIYNEEVYTELEGLMAVIGDLSEYSKEALAEDLDSLLEIVENIYYSNIHTVITLKQLPGEECLPYLEEAVKLFCGLNIVEVKTQDIEAILEELLGQYIDVTTIDCSSINFANDADVYAQLAEIAYIVVEETLVQGVSKDLLTNSVVFNALVDAYEVLLETSLLKAIAPAAIKAAVAKVEDNPTMLISDLAIAMGIENLSDEDIMTDLHTIATVARKANELGIINSIINKEEIQLTNALGYGELLSSVFDLNIIDNAFVNVIVTLLEGTMNINLGVTNIQSMDVDAEQAAIVELVVNALLIANSLGIETVQGAKEFAVEYIDSVKAAVAEAKELFAAKEYKEAIKVVIDGVIEPIRGLDKEAVKDSIKTFCDLQLVTETILVIYKQVIYEKLTGTLSTIGNVYDYSNEQFAEDLDTLVEIINAVYDSGIHEVLTTKSLPGEECIPYLEESVKLFCGLNIVEVKTQDIQTIIEKVLNKYIDEISVDYSTINFENDADIYAQLVKPTYVIVEQVLAQGLSKQLLNDSVVFNALMDVYEISLETSLINAIAPAVVKAAVAKAETNESLLISDLAIALNINNVSADEIMSDLHAVATIARNAFELGAVDTVLNKADIEITDVETYEELLNNLFDMYIVDNAFVNVMVTLIEGFGHVDLGNTNIYAMDVEVEQAAFIKLVVNGLVIANSLGIETLKGAKSFASEYIDSVKFGLAEAKADVETKEFVDAIKSLINSVIDPVKGLNKEAVRESIETLCSLQLVTEAGLEIYKQAIYEKLPSVLALVGDIHDYSNEQFAEDLDTLVRIINNLYDSGIYQVATIKQLPGEECIPYLEEVVRDICALNIVEIKKQDLGAILEVLLEKVGLLAKVNEIYPNLDLSSYDASSIDLVADSEIYVEMVSLFYVVAKGLLDAHFNAPFFGNTEAVTALVDAYVLSLDLSVMKVFAPKALDLIDALAAKAKSDLVNDDELVLNNIADILYGLIDLGLFSNNGIDFTNTAVVESMKVKLYEMVKLPGKVVKLINIIVENVEVYGYVPFSWNSISLKSELSVAKSVALSAKSLLSTYGSRLVNTDLTVLADANLQAEVNSLVAKMFKSKVVSQLFVPIFTGSVKTLSMHAISEEFTFEITTDDILNVELPNLWKIVAEINKICGLNPSNINFANIMKNLDSLQEILEILATDLIFKDNIEKLMTIVINKYSSYDLTAQERLLLKQIDFVSELVFSEKMFDKLQDTYNENEFTPDKEIIKNENVLNGIADAIKEILPSETFKVLAKKISMIVNDKVISKISSSIHNSVADRLDDESYTNEQVVEDYSNLVDLLKIISDANIIDNYTNIAEWDYDALHQIIDIAFDLNMISGHENEFVEAVINKAPIIKNYYDETIVISDWKAEMNAILSALESLTNDGITDFNNASIENISGTTIEYILKSEILSNFIVNIINDKLAENDLNQYYVVTKDSLSNVNDWDAELDAIDNLTSLMDSLNNNSFELSEVVDQYNNIRNNTILMNDILVSSASKIVPMMPVVKDYYDETVIINDWAVELDAIVASVDALDKANLDNIGDLLSEDSPLDGAMMLTFCGSTILKNAVVEEINKALESTGLESGLITVADVEVLSEEAWDAELSAMRNLISLKDNASTLEYTEIVKIYKEVRTTSLCNKVLIASAPTMAETLPVVSTYYDEHVVINDWAAELDSIVNTLDALSEANATAITNPLAVDSPLNGKVLNAATKSIILTKAMVDEMNNAVKASGLAENIITVENIQSVNTVEAWDAELDCMRRLVAIDFANTNMNSVIDIYDDVKQNTILCDTILVSSAEIIIPDLPIICNYYDESLGITDWDQELDSIVSAYKLLVNKGLANITNPIETLDGEVIIACLESKILKAAFVEEFNNNLTTLGLGAYYTMDDAKLAELDTPAKWDNELAAIQAVSDLVNNFSLVRVPAVKDQVESTIIAKAILVAFLSNMGILL